MSCVYCEKTLLKFGCQAIKQILLEIMINKMHVNFTHLHFVLFFLHIDTWRDSRRCGRLSVRKVSAHWWARRLARYIDWRTDKNNCWWLLPPRGQGFNCNRKISIFHVVNDKHRYSAFKYQYSIAVKKRNCKKKLRYLTASIFSYTRSRYDSARTVLVSPSLLISV